MRSRIASHERFARTGGRVRSSSASREVPGGEGVDAGKTRGRSGSREKAVRAVRREKSKSVERKKEVVEEHKMPPNRGRNRSSSLERKKKTSGSGGGGGDGGGGGIRTSPVKGDKMARYDIGFKARIANGWGFLSNFFPDVADRAEKKAGKKKPKKGQGPNPSPAHANYLFVDGEGKRWHSSEHYYQYHMYVGRSKILAKAIYDAPTSLQAKQLTSQAGYAKFMKEQHGSKSAAFYKREMAGWKQEHKGDSIRFMTEALAFKFSAQNPELRDALIATGHKHISEVGRMRKDFWAHTGQDMLGKLIMQRRTELSSHHAR